MEIDGYWSDEPEVVTGRCTVKTPGGYQCNLLVDNPNHRSPEVCPSKGEGQDVCSWTESHHEYSEVADAE